MTVKPLADRVVIKFTEAKEEKTASGLLLSAKAAASGCAIAEVVACGEGKMSHRGNLIPMTVKVGDKVLVNKTAGQQIKVDGEELTVVYEAELIAVVTD